MWIRNKNARLLFAGVFLAAFVLATMPVHASAAGIPMTATIAADFGDGLPGARTGFAPDLHPSADDRLADVPVADLGFGEPLSDAELADVVGKGSLLDGIRKVVNFILDVYDMFTNPERIPPFLI